MRIDRGFGLASSIYSGELLGLEMAAYDNISISSDGKHVSELLLTAFASLHQDLLPFE